MVCKVFATKRVFPGPAGLMQNGTIILDFPTLTQFISEPGKTRKNSLVANSYHILLSPSLHSKPLLFLSTMLAG